jgi:hypothetical protein
MNTGSQSYKTRPVRKNNSIQKLNCCAFLLKSPVKAGQAISNDTLSGLPDGLFSNQKSEFG